ncbi:hypothetical protein EV702DRAFT_120653 [Suillus placidus]|uniref:Uncharacterized protein n=1 Tax=Suillus placidus TaxID=48579 RepID=A0A9P6ZYT4_9AGAM|nr:hypothetical protein EV702DRAFT_120653 [Suillus placidus]
MIGVSKIVVKNHYYPNDIPSTRFRARGRTDLGERSTISAKQHDNKLDSGQKRRWSLMTFLYLSVRYAALPYVVIFVLITLPTISVADTVSNNLFLALNWLNVVITALLGSELLKNLSNLALVD